MDLDNYNRNTREGLHTTSIAGAWMNIVCGFGGLQADAAKLTLAPSIPKGWTSYSFRVCTGGSVIRVKITQKHVTLTVQAGDSVPAVLYGKEITVTGTPATFDLEAAQ